MIRSQRITTNKTSLNTETYICKTFGANVEGKKRNKVPYWVASYFQINITCRVSLAIDSFVPSPTVYHFTSKSFTIRQTRSSLIMFYVSRNRTRALRIFSDIRVASENNNYIKKKNNANYHLFVIYGILFNKKKKITCKQNKTLNTTRDNYHTRSKVYWYIIRPKQCEDQE